MRVRAKLGGWISYGLREAVEFAQRGYVCVTVNYRLLDEAPFPACIEDVKCAVRWLRANAQKYNIDPKRIGGSRELAQFLIDKRKQLLRRAGIAVFDLRENLRHLGHTNQDTSMINGNPQNQSQIWIPTTPLELHGSTITRPWNSVLRWWRVAAAYPQELIGFAMPQKLAESLYGNRATSLVHTTRPPTPQFGAQTLGCLGVSPLLG